jgi:hypothetical protein
MDFEFLEADNAGKSNFYECYNCGEEFSVDREYRATQHRSTAQLGNCYSTNRIIKLPDGLSLKLAIRVSFQT